MQVADRYNRCFFKDGDRPPVGTVAPTPGARLQPGDVGNRRELILQLSQQSGAVGTDGRVFRVDQYAVEEAVHRGLQLGQAVQYGGVIALDQSFGVLAAGSIQFGGEVAFGFDAFPGLAGVFVG